jgi:ketosteroid isomerase-like protein
VRRIDDAVGTPPLPLEARQPLPSLDVWIGGSVGSVILTSMSDVVRTSIGRDARLPERRTLDERVMVRWPEVYAAVSRATLALPPRSRLRRSLLRRSGLSGWGAWIRGDLDLVLVRFAPDFRYEPPREWHAAGMQRVYRGHAGLREWTAEMRDAWEWIENRPLEIVDAGDVIVFINHVQLRARGSGVEFDSRYGFVITMQKGLIVREQDFSDVAEALRTAGVHAPT